MSSGEIILTENNNNNGTIDRRTFLSKTAWGVLAVAGGLFAILAGGFLYPIPRKKPKPMFVCFLNDVPEEKPLPIQDLQGRQVYLLRDSEKRLLAISTVCTHLGCMVYYRPKEKEFDCPCHQGKFDQEGNPISGPPERPLVRYPVEIRDNKVFVQFS